MALTLYELVGAEGRKFSPYCWRIRLALAHKGLEAESVPVRFTDKALLAFSNQKLVPVLVDGETVVSDSWDIACYLEQAYPDRPPLFGSEDARGLCRFVNDWAGRVQVSGIFRMIVRDILDRLDPEDREYFRASRERRLGKTLEEIQADREQRVEEFRTNLSPLRATLRAQPFLGGDRPNYADYIVFGGFQWARIASPFILLENADPIRNWRERVAGLFDGLALSEPGFDW